MIHTQKPLNNVKIKSKKSKRVIKFKDTLTAHNL